ncbi:hypothetical protein [Streptomyces candidus]|uniref:Putative RNase H-like nuclease (RuvC/YqgF family) n=1 Tax=Streptomyces candidus TaxID=67283 RepID=A0A7X0HLZ9_9ACTN|nr:hypothetical protein [Streptomyces candidus]MBB6440121.1 putative RNase H-like nuclease (RuvC/YqgF family) [Streptomyces candidus]GHH58280.1 hypothetical protein GCM10018773_66420 [Streptomyces candidus]
MTDFAPLFEAAVRAVRAAANTGPDDLALAPRPRHTVDTITSDALDELYTRLAKAERAANLLADSHRRADAAEAEAAQLNADIDSRDKTIRHLEAGLTHERARAERGQAVLTRIRQMTDAWERRLPETVRTATVVDAIRSAMERKEPTA